MSARPLVCAACDEPSPGPVRRLYYQPRKHGPFFPILEQQKTGVKASLFSAGRVAVCTGCSSHLQRQWITYEKNWTPLEKRKYTLLAGIWRRVKESCKMYIMRDNCIAQLWRTEITDRSTRNKGRIAQTKCWYSLSAKHRWLWHA